MTDPAVLPETMALTRSDPAEDPPAGLRVLHWYPNFLGGGAVANAVAALAEAQARAGATPMIATVAARGASLYGSLDRVEEFLVPWPPSWTISRVGLLARGINKDTRERLRELRPDVVHVHGEFNPDNWWVPFLFSCPFILSPQGGFNPMVLVKGRRLFKQAYIVAAKSIFYRRVTAFHALSPLEEEHVLRLVPRASVYCVPQGPGPFTPMPATRPSAQGPADVVDIITVGRVDVFTKGLDILVEAFARAAGAEPRLGSLILVGPDWNDGRAQLERLAKSFGVADRVRFIGRVDGTAVGELLATSDVYVQASRHEGFSLAVAEALVAGKPVIMTRENGAAAYDEIASYPHVRVIAPRVDELATALAEFAAGIVAIRESADAAQPAMAEFLSWDRIARVHLTAYGVLARRAR